MSVVKNPVVRTSLFILGFCSVALGIVGAFMPVLPTTPFLLLAAWCFLKSSPKAHEWLYNQRVLGQALRDWEKNKSISKSTKIIAISMILVSLVFVWINAIYIWVKISVSVLLSVVSIFICTRKSS